MNILSIDDAIEELCFSETSEFETRKRKEAFKLMDTGTIHFVSTDYDDAVVAEARFRFGEELILSAVCAGKLKLLARHSGARPSDSVFMESVELVEVPAEDVRAATIDRIDGDLVVIVSSDADDDDGTEFVDLHLYEDEFDTLFHDVRSYRLRSRLDYEQRSYEPTQQAIDEGEESLPPTARAEKECDRWFLQQLETADDEEIPAKGAMLREAKSLFPRLSHRGFLRVWERRAPARWKRAGRKSTRMQ